jgi:hypothetical protein
LAYICLVNSTGSSVSDPNVIVDPRTAPMTTALLFAALIAG